MKLYNNPLIAPFDIGWIRDSIYKKIIQSMQCACSNGTGNRIKGSIRVILINTISCKRELVLFEFSNKLITFIHSR